MWKQWLNVVLGVVVAIVAYSATQPIWNAILGIVIALLALWSALEKSV
jgi:hypothetical protein